MGLASASVLLVNAGVTDPDVEFNKLPKESAVGPGRGAEGGDDMAVGFVCGIPKAKVTLVLPEDVLRLKTLGDPVLTNWTVLRMGLVLTGVEVELIVGVEITVVSGGRLTCPGAPGVNPKDTGVALGGCPLAIPAGVGLVGGTLTFSSA